MATLPTMTLPELRAAVRNRADMTHSEFISDDELSSYINGSLFELYDLLVTCYGEDYFVTDATATTTSGSDTVDLPTNFYKLTGVDLLVSAPGEYVTLRSFTMGERNRASGTFGRFVAGLRTNLQYRLRKNKLWLTPMPDAGQTLRLWYVPQLVPLKDVVTIRCSSVMDGDRVEIENIFSVVAVAVAGSPESYEFGIGATDTVTAANLAAALNDATDPSFLLVATSDGPVVTVIRGPGDALGLQSSNDLRLALAGGTATAGGYRLPPLEAEAESDGISGWLEFVIVDAAIKCLQKEESDVNVFVAQKNALIKRINNTAVNRDAANPARVVDVYATGGFDDVLDYDDRRW